MFHIWDPVQGLGSMEYVGLENITFALEDPLMWTSLENTIWLAVASGVPQHLVAIPLAYLINEYLGRYRDVAMGAYFVPYITSTVAISIMFTTLFSTDYGAVNAALKPRRLGTVGADFAAENIDWLGKPETVKPVLAFVVFWRYGFQYHLICGRVTEYSQGLVRGGQN